MLRGITMVMERDCVAVKLLASVTLKVTAVGPPAVVGVPEITPLGLSVRPAGNVPEAIARYREWYRQSRLASGNRLYQPFRW